MSDSQRDARTALPETAVRLERMGGVAIVTLDRPHVGNAFNGEMFRELTNVLTELGEDSGARALILTGAGELFCGGADVNDPYFDNPDRASRRARLDLGYGFARQLHAAPFPTICAINGACVAIGVSLAALCDIRIAADSARFKFGFARVGIFPDMSGSVMLPRLLGMAKALELNLLDRTLDAQSAHEAGLVNFVVPRDELMSRAVELATRLKERSPLAVKLSREAMTELPTRPFDEALTIEAAMVAEHLESEDLIEGIAAVRDGRMPTFVGR